MNKMDFYEIMLQQKLSGGGGGGGASAFIVNAVVEYNEKQGSFIINSVDKTFNEIKTAYQNNQNLVARINAGFMVYNCSLYGYSPYIEDEQDETFYFGALSPGIENMEIGSLEGMTFVISSIYTNFNYGTKQFT